ncbi:LysE family translocator [Gynuella sunshinyii]|uniref:Putative threonine efflux protein n=1 Tax=Gynuella sunshinyii YC6258 TaxID=1445510 RepID=A0A0C5W1P4_9GAMM|nr:LysE family translocator [Gynuella sunshinyii]AJQ96599.1 putative threonine efflux protein [Gynuella sunshinyii YC6258]
MIDLAVLPFFFASIFFLVISPGPDLLLISSYSSTNGFKSGLAISVGIFIAGIIQTMLVALGLGQLMQAMPVVAFGVKMVGALYLFWLGINLIRSWFGNKREQVAKEKPRTLPTINLVYRGCLNNLLNPKALLFFSMFLPQFTNEASSLSGQIMILGLILSVFALLVNVMLAFSFSSVGSYLGSKLNIGRHSDGLLGLIFVGLAARLAISK